MMITPKVLMKMNIQEPKWERKLIYDLISERLSFLMEESLSKRKEEE